MSRYKQGHAIKNNNMLPTERWPLIWYMESEQNKSICSRSIHLYGPITKTFNPNRALTMNSLHLKSRAILTASPAPSNS